MLEVTGPSVKHLAQFAVRNCPSVPSHLWEQAACCQPSVLDTNLQHWEVPQEACLSLESSGMFKQINPKGRTWFVQPFDCQDNPTYLR